MTDDGERKAVEMMRHAVGWMFRNAYCAERNSLEWAQWSGLATVGLARFGAVINDGRDQYFHVTPKGIAYLAKLEEPLSAHRPPPTTIPSDGLPRQDKARK